MLYCLKEHTYGGILELCFIILKDIQQDGLKDIQQDGGIL
jgi:hypothetical protein